MRRPVHLEPILRRLPPDRVPPALLRLAEVAAAARAERPLPFQVGWSNPANLLRLRGGPLRELVPFLRLGDGGVVAMWLAEAEPAVVLLGIDGECRVIAVNNAAADREQHASAIEISLREKIQDATQASE